MKLGQYELLGRIAVGGMAEIYRGRAIGEEGFEKLVAIKRILPHFARDTRFISMLVTEARIHAALSHRNIVQIHDLGISEEGEYFIVLEYVDGRDLGALLSVLSKTSSPGGRPLRPSDAVGLYIAAELAQGVHFAHELCGPDGQPLGLIHRDISPTNVLVSYASEVKLSDFGLAKRRTDHSVVGSIKGKLAYMSPEQARRAPLDRRSDIFAMGAVLFELLTGKRLRDTTDDLRGWQMVGTEPVPPARNLRRDIPPVLENLLARALALDPNDRFPDAMAFGNAARAALEQVPRARTSESDELQGLMRSLLPPGSPRVQAEPSKVIRLVSEFLPMEGPSPRALVPVLPTGPPPGRPPPIPGLTPAFPRVPQRDLTPAVSPTPLVDPNSEPTPAPPGVIVPFAESPPARPRVALWRVLVAVLIVLGGAAAVVHYTVVPLPVLALWLEPARLHVVSNPDGADVYLDGQHQTQVTPGSILVWRNLEPHLVELHKNGFQSVQRRIRFDRTEQLVLEVTLPPESRPAFEPLPATAARPDASPAERPNP